MVKDTMNVWNKRLRKKGKSNFKGKPFHIRKY